MNVTRIGIVNPFPVKCDVRETTRVEGSSSYVAAIRYLSKEFSRASISQRNERRGDHCITLFTFVETGGTDLDYVIYVYLVYASRMCRKAFLFSLPNLPPLVPVESVKSQADSCYVCGSISPEAKERRRARDSVVMPDAKSIDRERRRMVQYVQYTL